MDASRNQGLTADTLFVAMTRPSMLFGVTYSALIVNVVLTMETFILTGNESQGLPAEYAAAADVRVKMPMLGKADSLNAAVATAVMAYEVLNQRRNG